MLTRQDTLFEQVVNLNSKIDTSFAKKQKAWRLKIENQLVRIENYMSAFSAYFLFESCLVAGREGLWTSLFEAQFYSLVQQIKFGICPWIEQIYDSYWFWFLSNEIVSLTQTSQSLFFQLSPQKRKMALLRGKIHLQVAPKEWKSVWVSPILMEICNMTKRILY